MICIITLLPGLMWAEGENRTAPNQDTKQPRAGFVLPAVLQKYYESALNEVSRHNELQFLNQEIKNISYGENGNIESVSYNDGTFVRYSYKYDKNDKLESCAMKSGYIEIIFRESEEAEKKGLVVEVYDSKEPSKPDSHPLASTTSNKKAPAVVIYYPESETSLADLAKKPVKFDFKEIKKAIEIASNMKNEALKEYEKKTVWYYDNILKELKANGDKIALGNLKAKICVKKIYKKEMSGTEKRKAIDEFVQHIYEEAQDGGGRPAVKEFLAVEKSLKEKILAPEGKIYSGKIKDALEHNNALIDKLLNSKLAVYLNTKNDKIEAIINLPERKK